MALVTGDRVRDTSTTTGTGALTVSGTAPTGYRTFSAVCATNDTFLYFISHQTANEWECGLATYSAANTVTRTTVLASSNAGSAVSLSAGTKDVVLTQTCERMAIKRDISFGDDTTLYRDASSILALADQGAPASAAALRVYNTTDQVVTGTAPTNYERGVFDWVQTANVLTVGTQKGGTGSGRDMALVTGGTEAMRIDAAQTVNVGNFGAIVPDYLTSAPRFQVSGVINIHRFTADASGAWISFTKSRNATIGGKTAVSSGDQLGVISFDGMDGTATPVLREGANILGAADAAPTAGAVPGRLSFYTTNSGGASVEGMRHDSNQQLRFFRTPNPSAGSTIAQIRGDDQAGISIATSSNAIIAAGHSNLCFVSETTSNTCALYYCSGGSVSLIATLTPTGPTWAAPTTTPGASVMSVAWDGTNSYRIYTGSGLGTRTYKVFIIKLGA
jgi:hypothetical protein